MTTGDLSRPAVLRLRATLTDVLALIDQGLPGSGRVLLPSSLGRDVPLDPDARRRREHLPSDYANIGGRDPARGHTGAFASPWWRDSYRPGPMSEMFIAYCTGQIEMRRTLRQACYYVDVCGPGQAWHEIRAMKRERRGSGHFAGGSYVVDDRLWSDWCLCILSPHVAPSPGSPVSVTERGIVARLPESYDAARFAAEMSAEIRKGSVAAWLQTDEGRRHCALLGVEPSLGARFTSAPVGTGGEPRPVETIVARHQQVAQGRLIEIAERKILSHLRELCPGDAC